MLTKTTLTTEGMIKDTYSTESGKQVSVITRLNTHSGLWATFIHIERNEPKEGFTPAEANELAQTILTALENPDI